MAPVGRGPLLPFYFEPNRGQAHPRVQFIARGSSSTAYVLDREAVLRVGREPVTMRLLGARSVHPDPADLLPGISSYFTGSDRSQWKVGIHQYGRLRYRGVYPGIDLVYYGSDGHLEFDFVVAPGADPSLIRLQYTGASSVRVDSAGELQILTGSGKAHQHRPRVYQEKSSGRLAIAANYRLHRDHTVSFSVAKFAHDQTLVIDPVLDYGTYLGGNGYEQVNALKVDSDGNVYLAGSVAAPLGDANPWTSYPSAVRQAAVIKFSSSQNAVLYFVRLGGSLLDSARGLAIDSLGNAYVAGRTASSSFPIVNALQGSRRTSGISGTGFVTKISSDGSKLIFSTYLGGSSSDDALSVAVESSGAVFVAGNTTSADFPTKNALQAKYPGAGATMAFLSKLTSDGHGLVYSTYYGGSQYNDAARVSPDNFGGVYLVGTTNSPDFPLTNSPQSLRGSADAFAARFAPDGQSVIYSIVFGGAAITSAHAAVVDANSSLYIGGSTNSPDLPLLNSLQSRNLGLASASTGFLAKIAPNGSTLYSTYFGGSRGDSIEDLALDAQNSIYAAGWTKSSNFPVLASIRPYTPGGTDGADPFVARITPAGDQLLYSTLFGGSGDDYAYALAVASSGAVYVGGFTTSTDLPLKNAYQPAFGGNTDMFIVRIAADVSVSSPPLFSVSPAIVSFTTTVGVSQPAPQLVNIANSSGRTLTYGLSTSSLDNGSWLSAKPSSDSSFAVAVNSGALRPGRFGGTVRVSPSDGSTPLDLPVSLTLLSPAPVITSADPAALPITTGDVLVSIYGSGFDSSAVASVSLFNSMSYPLATTFVTSNILRVIVPNALLGQSVSFGVTVANSGSAVSNPITLAIGRGGPQITTQSVYGASGLAQAVAPGETITIYGANIGPSAPTIFTLDAAGRVDTRLSGTRVLFDKVAAPVLFASSGQVSAVVPFGLAESSTTVLRVEYQGVATSPILLNVAPAVPGIFTADVLGTGQGSIINSDGTRNAAASPAAPDSVIAIYASGGGLFSAPVDDGAVITDAVGLALPVSVTIDGAPAEVLYAGAAPGLVAGVLQINVRIPANTRTGSLEVLLHVGDASSQVGATVAVQ